MNTPSFLTRFDEFALSIWSCYGLKTLQLSDSLNIMVCKEKNCWKNIGLTAFEKLRLTYTVAKCSSSLLCVRLKTNFELEREYGLVLKRDLVILV